VEPVRALLEALGSPHLGRPTLHVAGSKGKGSTVAMAEAVLRAAGVNAGAYISPHLHHYDERIRIDGGRCGHELFAAAMTATREAMDRVTPRFPGRAFLAFDALTASAFVAFREAGTPAQVVEVGLGGLLDSTNVFGPDAAAWPHVCVVTPISLEHTPVLGGTIGEIAAQKAGIITPGATVVVAPQRESALDVMRAAAGERGARLLEVAAACRLTRTAATADHQDFRLQTPRATYAARLPLLGRHQLDNAAAAVVACEELAQAAGFELTEEHVRRGLAGVSWPARVEVLRRRPLTVVDGAHNGDSAKRLADALRDHFGLRQATLAFGTLEDKDVETMAAALAPLAGDVFCCAWPSRRAMQARRCAEAFRAQGAQATVLAELPQALEAAEAAAGAGGAIVACGSISFAAAVRECLLGIESDMIHMASLPGAPPGP
jgi:dihydrofolate synthase/folylpolyglutamate synthase